MMLIYKIAEPSLLVMNLYTLLLSSGPTLRAVDSGPAWRRI